ncbi:sugar ABC transporter substrate-binding protein [Cryobacterium sp. TMT1-66-1]|uniref:ABC transporter substrate-binding protein n=1 Tax=Cryobacterium sp. TMT1-66-1 TaxID=1259242 RepID=UPI00141A7091|nr:sugar ABC transporter substrate-binding protein [Cryobacterium sp. TMT1-66-1]
MKVLKTVPVAVIAVAALALSGCAGGGDEAADTAAAAGTLSVATWQFLEPTRGDALFDTINGYTAENPDVTLEKVEIARADYEKTLSTQFGAGAGPDVFVIPDAYFPQLADAGLLEPLDDVVSEANPTALRSINDNYVVDGSQLGLVWEVVPYSLFWNTDILAAAGVEAPTTVDELITAAATITETTGKTGFSVRHQMNEETPWWTDQSNWEFGYGGEWSDGEKLTIDSDENIEAVEAFKSVYDSPGFGKGQDASTYRSAFAAGELGMAIDNSSAVMTLVGDAVPADKIGSAVLPFPEGGSAYAGFSIGVNANSKNKEAAKDFIKWMLTDDAQQGLADTLFPSAIATEVAASDELLGANPWVAAFHEQVNDASSVIIAGFEADTSAIRTIVLTQIERVLTEGISAEEALGEAQKQAEALTQ